MQTTIFSRIDNASKPDFGAILSKSFELFKKIWKECLKHGLISLLVALPLLLLVWIPLAPMYIEMIEASVNGVPYYEPTLDYSVPIIIGYSALIILLSFVMQVISLSIVAHFYKVCKIEDLGLSETPGGYFEALKGNFTKLFVLSILTFCIAIVAALLCYLPIFYVMVPLQLINPIFAFNKKLSATNIVKASFKLGNKFWLIIFGLMILGSMIAQLGVFVCFVGVFVTGFFAHIPMYYVYKDAVGFEELENS